MLEANQEPTTGEVDLYHANVSSQSSGILIFALFVLAGPLFDMILTMMMLSRSDPFKTSNTGEVLLYFGISLGITLLATLIGVVGLRREGGQVLAISPGGLAYLGFQGYLVKGTWDDVVGYGHRYYVNSNISITGLFLDRDPYSKRVIPLNPFESDWINNAIGKEIQHYCPRLFIPGDEPGSYIGIIEGTAPSPNKPQPANLIPPTKEDLKIPEAKSYRGYIVGMCAFSLVIMLGCLVVGLVF